MGRKDHTDRDVFLVSSKGYESGQRVGQLPGTTIVGNDYPRKFFNAIPEKSGTIIERER